jgi:hypothetical protein
MTAVAPQAAAGTGSLFRTTSYLQGPLVNIGAVDDNITVAAAARLAAAMRTAWAMNQYTCVPCVLRHASCWT